MFLLLCTMDSTSSTTEWRVALRFMNFPFSLSINCAIVFWDRCEKINETKMKIFTEDMWTIQRSFHLRILIQRKQSQIQSEEFAVRATEWKRWFTDDHQFCMEWLKMRD
jgi:hypothetical protein